MKAMYSDKAHGLALAEECIYVFVVSSVLIVSHLQDEEQPTNEENMHLRHADLVARLERIEQGQASCCCSRRLE